MGYTSEMCNEVDCFGWWLARAHGGMAQMLFDFSMGRKVDNNSDMKERRKKSVKPGSAFFLCICDCIALLLLFLLECD